MISSAALPTCYRCAATKYPVFYPSCTRNAARRLNKYYSEKVTARICRTRRLPFFQTHECLKKTKKNARNDLTSTGQPMRKKGVEPIHPLREQEPESCASTNFATFASNTLSVSTDARHIHATDMFRKFFFKNYLRLPLKLQKTARIINDNICLLTSRLI